MCCFQGEIRSSVWGILSFEMSNSRHPSRDASEAVGNGMWRAVKESGPEL